MNSKQLIYRNGRFIGNLKMNEEEDDLQPESRYFKGKILKILDDVQLKRIHYKNDTAPLDEYIPLSSKNFLNFLFIRSRINENKIF